MPPRLLFASLASLAGIIGLVAWSDRAREQSQQRRAWQAEQREEALLTALDRPIHLARQTVTLAEFAGLLSRESGVRIELDEPAVEEQLWRHAHENSVRLPRAMLPLRTALDLALEQRYLTWIIRGDRVVITTKVAAADESLRAGVYPLPQPGLTDSNFVEAAWQNDIERLVHMDDWSSLGGRGHIKSIPGGLLVVHRPEVQHDLRRLVTTLAEIDRRPRTTSPVLLPADGDAAMARRILRKLQEPCSIDCRQMPLEELIEYLATEHDVPLVLDYAAIQDEGIDFANPVTQSAAGSLQSVLRAALRELELTYALHRHSIVVTSPSKAEERMLLVAYPVHDLIASVNESSTIASRLKASKDPYLSGYAPLIDTITAVIEPDAWEDVGGLGTIAGSFGGWVLIRQSLEAHQQIETLLADMRQALFGEAPQPPVFASPHARETEARVLAALEVEIPFDYDGWRLADVCDDLGRKLDIAVRLEQRQLESAGINVTAPVILKWPAAPLRNQLRRLCDALSMDYAIHNDGLVLTSEERTEDLLVPRVHDVRLLIDPDLGVASDEQELIDLLVQHIAPDSWFDVGGPAPLESFRGLLVFAQTEAIHREVEAFLSGLEEHCLRRIGKPPAIEPVWVGLDAADREIVERLAKEVSVRFCGEPLEDALQKLAVAAGVQLVFDQTDISDEERSKRLPITLLADEIAGSGILERLMSPESLDCVIRRGKLVVIPDDQRIERITRLYPVADLAGPDVSGFEDRLFDDVKPEQWDIAGGPNGANILFPGWLVVSGTLKMHWQVEDWLYQQRTGTKTRRAQLRQETEQEAEIRGAIYSELMFGGGIDGFWRWLDDRNDDDGEVAP